MTERKHFTMTEEQHQALLKSCQPVPYLVIGGHPPASPQENANRAWQALGKELGFEWDTVEPVEGQPETVFSAVPIKCDGNHGGPRCADPECWNTDPPVATAEDVAIQAVGDALSQVKADPGHAAMLLEALALRWEEQVHLGFAGGYSFCATQLRDMLPAISEIEAISDRTVQHWVDTSHTLRQRLTAAAADLENAAKLVVVSGLSTGHADSVVDLVSELLHQYAELRERNTRLQMTINEQPIRDGG